MKKTILTLSLITLTSLMANNSHRAEIDLSAGYNKFDSASLMENASVFGIRASVYENVVNKYAFQVGYEGGIGIKYDTKANKKVNKTDLHRVFTHLVIDGDEEYDITPYLLLGLGYEYLSDEIKGEPSQGFVDLGIGFKYFLGKNFNVSVETRGVGKFNTRDLDLTTNIGLGYMFGGKYETSSKPIAALDEERKNLDSILPPRKVKVIEVSRVQESAYPEEVNTMSIIKSSSYHDSPSTNDATQTVVSGDYYVQMAAYRTTPIQPLINELAEHGIENSVVHKKGARNLVLVGPFIDRSEALAMLDDLKTIRSDAFIVKMK